MDFSGPGFPVNRLRRLRQSEKLRDMFAETTLTVNDLVLPLFVSHGKNVKNEIPSMPGIFQLSIDNLSKECEEIMSLGVPAVILFGIPETKDAGGTSSYHEHGIIQDAIRHIKKNFPELYVITDVCLCEYTDHGHCGIIENGRIMNDPTLEALALQASSHASAGADMVAPSDMMDGRVKAIRTSLDTNGFPDIPIMAYSAKYASAFYGPFREAAGSTPQFGDRKSYQMDHRNTNEAMREIAEDIKEGADIIMVKPALSYLDIIRRAKDTFNIPVAAYNVSGEYSLVKAAAEKGWVDGERIMMEVLYSIKRAGANMILTYFAKEAAAVLKRQL